VYLRSLPETAHLGTRFSNTSGAGGERLFEAKGCVNCHHGELALENRLKNMTLTDIAVDMWNGFVAKFLEKRFVSLRSCELSNPVK
jgi:hypothetical protein